MITRNADYLNMLNEGELGRMRALAGRPVPLKELAERAAIVASQGFWVFPANGKIPCTEHGIYDATDHPDKVRTLFRSHRNATHIGVRTGVLSMIVAIDVDPAGRKWLLANWHRLGDPAMHLTPRGGVHLIYKMPKPPTPVITCRQSCGGVKLLAEGVDIKGEGGSVIWAGSPGYLAVHDVRPCSIPTWMLRRLLRKPQDRPQPVLVHHPIKRLEGALRQAEYSKRGERNDYLFWAGCRAGELVRDGVLSKQEAINMVEAVGIKIGLDDKDPSDPKDNGRKGASRATAKSAVETGMRSDRSKTWPGRRNYRA